LKPTDLDLQWRVVDARDDGALVRAADGTAAKLLANFRRQHRKEDSARKEKSHLFPEMNANVLRRLRSDHGSNEVIMKRTKMKRTEKRRAKDPRRRTMTRILLRMEMISEKRIMS
jgi:hypothetical protein